MPRFVSVTYSYLPCFVFEGSLWICFRPLVEESVLFITRESYFHSFPSILFVDCISL